MSGAPEACACSCWACAHSAEHCHRPATGCNESRSVGPIDFPDRIGDTEPTRMENTTWPHEGDPWPLLWDRPVCVTECKTMRPMAWEWKAKHGRGDWALVSDDFALYILAAWARAERERAARAAEDLCRLRAALADVQAAARAYAAEGVSPGPGPLIEAVLRAGLAAIRALPTEPSR